MNIAELTARFEHYAISLKRIKHEPDNERGKAFFCLDLQDIAVSIKSQAKFPCLFLQLPEIEKAGEHDSISEAYEGSWVILTKCPDRATAAQKTAALTDCKQISDLIYNRLLLDSDEFFDGAQVKTAEGSFGPVATNVVGWGVNFGFDHGYDAGVDANEWEDLH